MFFSLPTKSSLILEEKQKIAIICYSTTMPLKIRDDVNLFSQFVVVNK
jgi:hypothetical protein